MVLFKILNISKKLRLFLLVSLVAISSTAFAESSPMSALVHINRAYTYIAQRIFPSAHQEIYSAIDNLRFIRDRRAQQAISFLSQANLTLDINEAQARDSLYNGETVVRKMVFDQSKMPSQQVLQDSLDHIYIADDKIAHHEESSARSNLRYVIDTLSNYSIPEMIQAVEYLHRSFGLVGRNNEQSRTELNNAETIVERALRK
jgi:hypothetical protein